MKNLRGDRQLTPQHRPRPSPTVARYTLSPGDEQLASLPVTDTLAIAEQARRALMGLYGRAVLRAEFGRDMPGDAKRPGSLTFSGKDPSGRPLTGHQHAFYLPTDEDDDGLLDHLTVVAERGFDPDEVLALDRLRRLHLGEGEPLRLQLVGLGSSADFRCPLFGVSSAWESATPFLVTRQPKRRGQRRDPPDLLGPAHRADFARHVLMEELARLRQRRPDLPEPVAIDFLEDRRLGPRRLLPIQFRRARRKTGDDGNRRAAAGFRIIWGRPIRGPLCLGHSCHFGLGLFLPVRPPRTPATD